MGVQMMLNVLPVVQLVEGKAKGVGELEILLTFAYSLPTIVPSELVAGLPR